MRISVLQESLNKALGTVIKAIDARPPLPVLANVLLEAEDSRLRIAASNLNMSITVWIGAKVDRSGTITLPAKTFSDLVGRLAKERVDLTLDELTNSVHLVCAQTEGNIKGIAATEYPPIKQSDEPGFVVQGGVLKEMIQHTAFAAAKEDNRPILTGVFVQVKGSAELGQSMLTLAAADGYRLAVREAWVEGVHDPRKMVIPARMMMILADLIDDDHQPVSVSFPNDAHIVTFRLPNMDISCQLVDGLFPDFAPIIPKSHTTRVTAPTQALLKMAQLAEIFARDDAHSGRLIVTPPVGLPGIGTEGSIMIAGRSAERGHSDNSLTAQVEGEKVEMHFDLRFIVEMLSQIDEECVTFEANGNDSPGVWQIAGRTDYTHVQMPMTR